VDTGRSSVSTSLPSYYSRKTDRFLADDILDQLDGMLLGERQDDGALSYLEGLGTFWKQPTNWFSSSPSPSLDEDEENVDEEESDFLKEEEDDEEEEDEDEEEEEEEENQQFKSTLVDLPRVSSSTHVLRLSYDHHRVLTEEHVCNAWPTMGSF